MPDPTEPAADAGPDREKVAALRAGLPATGAGIYLDTGTCGPVPAESMAAMRLVEDRELAIGRAVPGAAEELADRMAEARAALAAVLGTDMDRVALTHSTTEGLGLAVGTLAWRPGDRALTTSHEHPGLLRTMAALRDRHAVEVRITEIGDGGDDDRTLGALERELVAGRVRLVALSHVLWTSGAVLPIADVVRLAEAHGATVVVDGAQAAGAIPLQVDDLGAHFYACPGQKWLLGPSGTGALVVRPDVARRSIPGVRGPFSVPQPGTTGEDDLWPDARRFEVAGFGAAPLAGLARSAGWLAMYVGLPWAHERSARLAHDVAGRLGGIPGVEVITPAARMATLVTFRVHGWSAARVAAELAGRVFASVGTLAHPDVVRLSIGFFTTHEELHRVVDVVEIVARHTPETLPARPTVEFLDAPHP